MCVEFIYLSKSIFFIVNIGIKDIWLDATSHISHKCCKKAKKFISTPCLGQQGAFPRTGICGTKTRHLDYLFMLSIWLHINYLICTLLRSSDFIPKHTCFIATTKSCSYMQDLYFWSIHFSPNWPLVWLSQQVMMSVLLFVCLWSG